MSNPSTEKDFAGAENHEGKEQLYIELQCAIANLHEYLVLKAFNQTLNEAQYSLLVKLHDARGKQRGERVAPEEIPANIKKIYDTIQKLQSYSDESGLAPNEYFVHLISILDQVKTEFASTLPIKSENTSTITRRQFLGATAVVAITTWLGFKGMDFIKGAAEENRIGKKSNGWIEPGDKSSDKDLESLLKFYLENYGLEVYGRSFPIPNVEADSLSDLELKQIMSLLKTEIMKYPVDYFRNNKISKLVLIENLTVSGKPLGGLSYGGSGIVYISLVPSQPHSVAAALHHEMYHACDIIENGMEGDDKDWREIYHCTCQIYTQDADQDAHSPMAWFVDPSKPSASEAFVEPYAKKNPQEDRAETAAAVMMQDSHERFLSSIENFKKDNPEVARILETKYRKIISDYLRFSNGLMGAQFWQDLLSGKFGD